MGYAREAFKVAASACGVIAVDRGLNKKNAMARMMTAMELLMKACSKLFTWIRMEIVTAERILKSIARSPQVFLIMV